MQHIIFRENTEYKVAILIKSNSLRKTQMETSYIQPLRQLGVKPKDIIAFDLVYGPKNKKPPVKIMRAYLQDLMPILKEQGVEYLYVPDAEYFKVLTGEKKADPHHGYALPCIVDGYSHMKVVLGINHSALFYNPDLQTKLDMGLQTLADTVKGNYKEIGTDIVKSAKYIRHPNQVYSVLQDLKEYDALTVDTETLSLSFWKTGVVTIGFAWDQHNGVVIWCDDYHKPNSKVRQLLKEFFFTYRGKCIYHNANYDMKILINTLFMNGLLDEKGKQEGIEVMTRNFDDTKLLTYLATNSCAGNNLSLKEQSHEFTGNFAEDVQDITKLTKEDLEVYQLKDCLATWYVHNKHYPTVVKDQQLDVYENIMKPSVKVVLQMELTGMPVDMKQVKHARKVLEHEIEECHRILNSFEGIKDFIYMERENAMHKRNAELKTKVKPIEDFDYIVFNPNSNPMMQRFLYDFLDFPIVDKTPTGAGAVGGETLMKLYAMTDNDKIKEVLKKCVDFFDADKILGTFIKAFEKAVLKSDGHYYVHGNFNIGGTVSGRLSSSGPNMQNIPSTGATYAKLVKSCFVAPPGWVFMGADFASLEDRISALTTRDPEKLKVYTDGYDGHCLRAYSYFKHQMPDIDPNSVKSINSIKKKYPELRQKSKSPTFLLTYGGTYHGLMGLGLTKEEAIGIETNYHNLYQWSDDWVQDKISRAAIDGYVTVAFGLRVRTPVIKQSLMGNSRTPYEAKAEGRTAGNALGQSYGLLNNRAGIDLQERTFDSDFRYDILPVAHIHDAQYFMVRDDLEAVEWLNHNLVECMEWQELPEIQHDSVGLGGELSLFYPTWKDEVELPNGATQDQIKEVIQDFLTEAEAA
ncbi:DNA polymerase [Alteromonas sp. BMJM2]|uniref:DNA polymerase n=1 Tax=Alteromonas sp. BMJM2 TaxID=2954241 RepID=UPI0022B51192|nr:DNA polymerase [Alteromonas sp. BMJM2]